MKTKILVLILISAFLSIGAAKHSTPVLTPSPSPLPSVTAPSIRIVEMDNYTADEKANAKKAEEIIQRELKGDCLKSKISSAKFTETKLSGAQVWNLIEGSSVDVRLTMYNAWYSKVLGYVNGDGYIHTNRKFYAGADPKDIAGNIFHETLHDPLGFTHYKKPWQSSVPYLAGSLLIECAGSRD